MKSKETRVVAYTCNFSGQLIPIIVTGLSKMGLPHIKFTNFGNP